MEKIMQFRSNLKVPVVSRHNTTPQTNANLSDTEDYKQPSSTLSPLYKKQAQHEENLKELSIFKVPKISYEGDESDTPSPESSFINLYKLNKNNF